MELAIAVIFGLVIGSFLNVCIVRMPVGASINLPRSHCPNCKALIAAYDNIPVLSYLILGGRCRRCRQPISPRYPAVEAANGLISGLLYWKFGLSLEWGIFLAFCSALVVLALIDVDHRILPDPITLNGIWAGALASFVLAQPSVPVSNIVRAVGLPLSDPRGLALVSSVLGMIAGGGLLWLVAEVYLKVRGIEGMGFGDVKMMAMVGAFLGAPLALMTIMIGSLLGSVIGLLLIQFGGKTRQYELPFGTFLGLAGIVSVIWGESLIRFYVDRVIGSL